MLTDNWLIESLDSIDSTQNYAKSLKAYGKQIAVIAKQQTKGYGQYGREWISMKGNLYLSLIIPTENITSDITLVSAVVIGDIISRHGIYIQYRWVNDILINGAKVGGILTEYYKGNLIIGIGLNLKHNPDNITNLNSTNLSLNGVNISSEIFLEYILSSFTKYYNQWLQGGFKVFKNLWKSHAYKLNENVTITDSNSTINGIFIDIDDSGNILIENNSGIHRLQQGSLR